MSTDLLLIVLLGALVGAGVLLLVTALRGTERTPKLQGGQPIAERLGRLGLAGIAAGVLTLVVTQWPVAAISVGLLVAFWPAMFGGANAERMEIARLEGLASWTESLRDTIAGAVGLEQAIPATAYAASPAIAPELRLLTDRLRVRVPMPTALQRFADDLNDPSADLVVAALILNARLRGPGLRAVLTSLAGSARAELDMRQRVAAGRRSTRRSVQIVVVITLVFVLGLVLFNRSYVEPYTSATGQVVLALIVALFGAGFLWLRRLSRFEVPETVPRRHGRPDGGCGMTLVLLSGAVVGLGLLMLTRVVAPQKANPAAGLIRLDSDRRRLRTERIVAADPHRAAESARLRRLGGGVRRALAERGIELNTLRGDLSMLGRSLDVHLAVTVLAAAAGFIVPIVAQVVLSAMGGGLSGPTPLWIALLCAVVAAVVPTLQVRSQAEERRRAFRHVVGSYLDLVAMNLSGGRGVPEALESAAAVSDGWAMVRIRDTLSTARLQGITPWAALGELGEELRIEELRDLAAALALVAEDGARVRESLSARAGSLRSRELAEAEGRAQERSQSMLVAQMLLAAGFLLFLTYPAVARVMG